MHRFVTAFGLAALVGGCASVDMPELGASHPDWVEDRIESGEWRRNAPDAIPDRQLEPGEAEAMDEAAARLLEQRDRLNAEAEVRDGTDPAPTSASDFVSEGQDRTTPPQDR
ncbi:MAG: hypothetical protein U9P68_14185 [Pseudomonadota bacterium]|nr:hypothetical protein [Pseudomonadota bacterium]